MQTHSGFDDRISRSRRASVLALVAAAGLALGTALPAHANCNLIPAAIKEFPSKQGSVGQAVALPGDTVTVRVDLACDATAAGFSEPASNNEVTLTFEPPRLTGLAPEVVVAPGFLGCDPFSDNPCVSVANCGDGPGARCDTLLFVVPDTGLTGPVRITVESVAAPGAPLAEIATLFEPTLSCEDRVPEEVFQRFTILPPINSFQDSTAVLLATLDGGNNLLIPLDFTTVIAGTAGDAVARIVNGRANIDDGLGEGKYIQAPEGATRAFTITGRPIPPILEPGQGGEVLFGSVDAEKSVLRIARLDPNTGQEIYDLTERLRDAAPIEITGAELAVGPACSLSSLQSSTETVACAGDETVDGNLNGDNDATDQVVQILDLDTGGITDTGIAVAQVTASPARPALRTGGEFSVFLQSEFRGVSLTDNGDVNGDGDAMDSILRVLRKDGTDLTALGGVAATADAEPLVNGTQAVVDGSLVYFRTRESDEVPWLIERGGLGNGATESFLGATSEGGTSADGRYVAFWSGTVDLVPGDTNASADVFVHNRETKVTTRVSVDSAGNQAFGGGSWGASISADGRFVAFMSYAPNLVVGDTNGLQDIFVHDRDTDEDGSFDVPGAISTERVSEPTGGGQADRDSSYPDISNDGRFVVFHTDATNLDPPKTNYPAVDVFVHDRHTRTTERVSVSTGGVQGNGSSNYAHISEDGRFVAFQSKATNFVAGSVSNRDIFVRDLQAGVTERVSLTSDSTADCQGAHISADGRFVVFASSADDLVEDDTGAFADVFVFDRQKGTTERVSVGPNGEEANGSSLTFSEHGNMISTDGRFVAFLSSATNFLPALNGNRHVFLRDRRTGSTMLVSVDSSGVQGNGHAGSVNLTPDGRVVVFESTASNLVPADGNSSWDVFVREPGPGPSINADGDLLDTVLRVFDTATLSLRSTPEVAASEVAVASGRALLITPEADEGDNGGTDLTKDGDKLDDAAQLYDALSDTPTPPVNLRTPSNRVALSEQVACLSIPEAQLGLLGEDRNSDGDPDDDVIGGGLVASLLTQDPPSPMVGTLALEAVAALGSRCVFLLSEAAQGGTSGLGTDFNADSDADDLVVQAWDAASNSYPLTPELGGIVPRAAAEFVVGDNPDLVAFRTCEADEGAGGTDLNQDGDKLDCVMQLVDFSEPHPKLINTERAAEICDFDGCDPFYEPYRIRGETVSFVSTEAAQSGPDAGNHGGVIGGVGCGPLSLMDECDLTGDGDNFDTVITVVNLVSWRVQIFEIDGADPGEENPFPKTVIDQTVLSLRSPDGQSKIVGDVDDDETLDTSTTIGDNCQEDPNPEQTDGDDDQLGDTACDDHTDTVLPGEGVLCDVDLDGDIDQADYNIIVADSGMEARESDPRDTDGDGWVEAEDAALCEAVTAIVEIDIKPDSTTNPINVKGKGLIPVAILGSFDVDVADVDVTTLSFGPAGAMPAHDLLDSMVYADHVQNVNFDGSWDLVSHYPTRETGIVFGDESACLQGEIGGLPFSGCNAIKTTNPAVERRCGTGVELVLLLPLLAVLRRRRRG